MRRFVIFLIIFILFYTVGISQINKFGIPLIRNYLPQEYGAVEQNWSVVKDNRGVMYFGNNDAGVIEYDGVNWKKIPVTNKSIIRSLAVDEKGTIFVGAVGEFGFLCPDKTGNIEYKSLLSMIDSAQKKFTNVWKIYSFQNKIYFCTQTEIFIYDYNTIKTIIFPEKYCFLTFILNDRIFVGNYLHGLMELKGDSLIIIKGGEVFSNKNISSIIQENDSILLVGTGGEGFQKFNMISGIVDNEFQPELINDIINKSYYYQGEFSNINSYFLSTVYDNGLLITDSKLNLKNKINKAVGLSTDRVFYSYQKSNDEPLWLATEFGVSKININTPFSYFGDLSGLKGGVNDVVRFNNVLYVATSVGVFYLTFVNQMPSFVQIDEIGATWSFCVNKVKEKEETLIAATQNGVYEIFKNNTYSNVENRIDNLDQKERKITAYKVYQSKINNDIFYIGTGSGFIKLLKNNNRYQIEFENREIKEEIRSFCEDDKGIWLASAFSGVFRFRNNVIEKYGMENGLPSLSSNYFFEINKKMILATEKGLYTFNYSLNKFEKYIGFGNEFFDGSKGIFKISQDLNGKIWLSLSMEMFKERGSIELKKWVETVQVIENKIIVDSLAFKFLPNLAIDVIFNDENGITWLGNSKGLYSFNSNFKRDYHDKFNTLIRKVNIGVDSVIFFGSYYKTNNIDTNRVISLSQPEELIFSLDYNNNNITFEYSAPYFDSEEYIEYSTFLEGYKEDIWSKWTFKNERVFTNLSEGNYIFKVKARNIYGSESEIATFNFTVLPPWYRTVWAYILYGILSIVIIYIIIKIYTRRLELEKIRLEGIVVERTAEVVRQKDDIEKKNVTLEHQKIEIERQKDLVIEQKNHIEHIHDELKDSILYAERIQKAILPHPDFADAILKDYFILFKPKDIVSGDFYFATKVNNFLIFAAADCTGHGVPGAFMSMMGVAFLNEIVNDESIVEAGQALDLLRDNIIKSLQQTGKSGEQKDGMDISFCVVDENTNILQWAGANNPLYIIRKHRENNLLSVKAKNEEQMIESIMTENNYDLFELKPDKMPVAIYVYMDNFTNNIIQLEKGDTIYSFTDGFADQFGGERGKKFMYKPFKKLLLELQSIPMSEQRLELDLVMEAWKSHIDPITNEFFEQIDDICIVAKRV